MPTARAPGGAPQDFEILVEHGGLAVVEPRAAAALARWAHGARWEAARSEDAFADFTAHGPCAVVALPGGTRLLFSASFRWRNAETGASEEGILLDADGRRPRGRERTLAPVVRAAAEQRPGLFCAMFPHGAGGVRPDAAAREEAVVRFGLPIHLVPAAERTGAMCLAAVRRDAWTVRYAPNRLLTPELCRTAVAGEPRTLGYVPKRLMTPELCLLAVRGGLPLGEVPERFRAPEVCLEAARQDPEAARAATPPALLPAVEETLADGPGPRPR